MTHYGLRISEYRTCRSCTLFLTSHTQVTSPWHRGSGCLGAAAPVTGAAADEHNLNVVDCDTSVTVPRLYSAVTVSSAGPRGLFKGMTTATSGVIDRFPLLLPVRNSVASYGASAVTRTSDSEANVKDNGFPWPPPGLLGNFYLLKEFALLFGFHA